jgi:hypothetical protein
MLRHVVCLVEIYPRFALMMEAANTSETSVNFYQTARRNIPSELRSLKRFLLYICFIHQHKNF